MEAQTLTFSLIDKSSGYEATPKRVKPDVLARFSAEVSDLIRGSQREVDPANIDVSVRTGSIAIQTEPIASAPTLFRDLRALQETEFLDAVDPKRRVVIEQWQRRASQIPALAYEINAPFLQRKIAISAKSDYRANDADQWVVVERYVTGEVRNVGGASRSNAHLELPDGTTLIVATERGILEDDPLNRIYKKATLRIRAKYNVVTRELTDARLLEFVDYAPRFDEHEMERLAKRGEQAWKDVADASAWVDDMRGRD